MNVPIRYVCFSAARSHLTELLQSLDILKQQLSEMTSSCTKTNIPNWNIHNNQAGRSPLYLNESGVYELVFKSDMPQAVRFREWIVEVVLPDIRQTGKYVREQQVLLMNENDLHFKVVHFIRNYWKEAVIIAGLGEMQDTNAKQIESWKKGYTKGQPDILLLNRSHCHSGLAIELKTPLGCGTTSDAQEAFLQALQKNKYETLLSNCYDDIIVKIIEYRLSLIHI